MNRLDNILGLAKRARKLSVGDAVLEDIRKKKAKLVVICSDASENTKKKISDKCTYYGIPYLYMEDSVRLNTAIGSYNYMAVAVLEDGFAKMIETYLTKG